MNVFRTRIKFCGITRAQDADAAVAAGADAIGLVFVPGSRRCIDRPRAAVIRGHLPAFVQAVALLRNPDANAVAVVLRDIAPDLLQFHGEEPPEFCRQFGRPYVKVVPMGSVQDLALWNNRYADAAALLLDAHVAGGMGGQGTTFDWSRIRAIERPVVLAGGLTPENVGAAIRAVHPYAVDVSSGIESAPGIKDHEKMRRFAQEVARVDAAE